MEVPCCWLLRAALPGTAPARFNRGKFPRSGLITKTEEASGKSFKPWAPPRSEGGSSFWVAPRAWSSPVCAAPRPCCCPAYKAGRINDKMGQNGD